MFFGPPVVVEEGEVRGSKRAMGTAQTWRLPWRCWETVVWARCKVVVRTVKNG